MSQQPYSLVGVDGNAWSVMGYVKRAMSRARYSRDEVQAYIDECLGGDYDKLLNVSMKQIDEVNEKLGLEEEE